MTDADQRRPWYFGVACSRCAAFVPVERDPSDGRPGTRYAVAGTVIVVCTVCGNRGRYPVARIERRRVEPRRAVPRA